MPPLVIWSAEVQVGSWVPSSRPHQPNSSRTIQRDGLEVGGTEGDRDESLFRFGIPREATALEIQEPNS